MKYYLGASVFALASSFALLPNIAAAEPSPFQETLRLSDAQDGSLLFKTDIPGQFIKAPMVATDAKINVAGPVIRTTLSQTFKNTSNEWTEGVYVFPLPEGAAVDRLKMVIGGRLIEGKIKEKAEAKKIYETAKSAGKKASLLTQERPNIFTSSVANIGPGETVSIQIEYQDKARMRGGVFSLRFPMTVAPRFSPPRETLKMADADGKVTMAILDPVLDRARITPPLLPPDMEPSNFLRLPVTLTVNLDAGFPLADIESPYHDIQSTALNEGPLTITLKDGPVPANKDFKLEWQAQPATAPYSKIFTETVGGETFAMAMLTPAKPAVNLEPARRARESLFVIDTSGSMGGKSIDQAKAALTLAVEQLGEGDYFNITRFSSNHTSLFKAASPVSEDSINAARHFISRLRADGGTQMVPALDTVLSMKPASPEHIRQIIFITDGAIGNERQMFSVLKHDLKDGRFFPVGIGSAPNSHFMSRAAKFGRGTYVQIGKTSEVQTRMSTLFKAIDRPVLTHISANMGKGAETYPARIPDLYDGEPVVFVTKLANPAILSGFSLTGKLAQDDWRLSSPDKTSEASGIAALWARQKIADLEDQRFDRAAAANIDSQILKTALKYSLVSRLTSLVAVDVTPSRPVGEGLTTAKVPTQLPEGWDFAKLQGRPQAAQPGALPRPAAPSPAPVRAVPVPSTASAHNLLILLGLLMMGISRIFRRRPV